MRALVFVVIASIAISAYAGNCLGVFPTSKAVDSHTTTCPQYAGDSCCAATFTEQSCSSYDGCRRYPDTCSFLQGLLNCGTLCKPNFFQDYAESLTKIRLCDKYYDAMEKACLDVKVCDRNGNSSIDCRQNSNSGNCQNLYDNAADFWQKTLPLGVIRATDNCFSAGFAVLPSFVMVVAALIVAFFH